MRSDLDLYHLVHDGRSLIGGCRHGRRMMSVEGEKQARWGERKVGEKNKGYSSGTVTSRLKYVSLFGAVCSRHTYRNFAKSN